MAKRTDANQKEIVQAFRDRDATVAIISDVGHGKPDLIVGYRGNNYLVEIKDGKKPASARRLTPAEDVFHRSWKGQVCIITSIEDVILFINEILN